MATPFEQLKEFHEVFDHARPERPSLDGFPFELRCKLIFEEAQEFIEASGFFLDEQPNGIRVVEDEGRPADWVEMIDGLCDLLYVTYGAFVSMGLDPKPFFDEVHRSNMAKRGGTKNEYGKTMKPPGWTPPDIARLLKEATDDQRPDEGEG